MTKRTCLNAARLAVAVALLSMAPVALAAQDPDTVTWIRDPTAAEPTTRTGLRVACGSYGVFHFEIPGGPKLASSTPSQPQVGQAIIFPKPCPEGCDQGQEIPPLYPSHGLVVATVPAIPAAQLPIGQSAISDPLSGKRQRRGGDVRGKATWIPCADAACFDQKGSVPATGPWVAVIDWDDAHGWSAGWTIRELAGNGTRLALLPFLTPDLNAFSTRGTSDVHTLVKLCQIAESVDRGGARPLVINMSFGRLARSNDGDRGAFCQPDLLSCQIVRTLEHLYQAPSPPGAKGSVAVAAAGNYRDLLFPAVVQTVIPAGGLDLPAFAKHGQVLATWETAPEMGLGMTRSRALLPASGVCLESTLGQPASPSWMAPPGTSYSAALLAGWLSGELQAGAVPDPLANDLWTLQRSCVTSGCSYRLQQGAAKTYGPHPASDLLFGRLFDSSNRTCGPPPETGDVGISLTVASNLSPDPTGIYWSFMEMLNGGKAPAPDSNPCVPCAAIRPPPDKAMGFDAARLVPLVAREAVARAVRPEEAPRAVFARLASTTPAGPTSPSVPASPVPVDGGTVTPVSLDWYVDLSEAGPFAEGTVIDEVYLRVGTAEFHRMTALPSDVVLLQKGQASGLFLRGAGSYMTADKQASLLFVLHLTFMPQQLPYWTSIPVYFR